MKVEGPFCPLSWNSPSPVSLRPPQTHTTFMTQGLSAGTRVNSHRKYDKNSNSFFDFHFKTHITISLFFNIKVSIFFSSYPSGSSCIIPRFRNPCLGTSKTSTWACVQIPHFVHRFCKRRYLVSFTGAIYYAASQPQLKAGVDKVLGKYLWN